MKSILVLIPLVFLSSALALADDCRFSKRVEEHSSLTVPDCSEKLCYHTIVCGSEVRNISCRSKNGVCDGYSADNCKAGHDLVAEAARFVTTKLPDLGQNRPRPSEGVGGR
ncbi:MAG: hypothetical protein K2X47_12055 [Bdellovibrionales bacterium]|nr:hypothetical protein [Bdellovibrionales bacterium]